MAHDKSLYYTDGGGVRHLEIYGIRAEISEASSTKRLNAYGDNRMVTVFETTQLRYVRNLIMEADTAGFRDQLAQLHVDPLTFAAAFFLEGIISKRHVAFAQVTAEYVEFAWVQVAGRRFTVRVYPNPYEDVLLADRKGQLLDISI